MNKISFIKLIIASLVGLAMQAWATTPQVVRFEWHPSPTEINLPAYFYWDIRNVKECYSTTSGSGQPELKATSGTIGPSTNSFPYSGNSKWYCIDLQGKRFPEDPTKFLEATRSVEAPLSAPVLTKAAGAYETAISVGVNGSQGVLYRYSLDGSSVNEHSAVFPAALTLNRNTTLKVRGFRTGFNPGPEITAVYTFNIKPVVKRFEWNPNPVEVGMPTYFYWDIENVQECYTTTSGVGYVEKRPASGTIGPASNTVPNTGVSKWYCTDLQGNRFPADPMSYLEATRIIEAPLSTPVLTPAAGTYTNSVDVTLSRQNGVQYRYTVDGREVTENSSLLPSTLKLTGNTVLNVRGFRPGFNATAQVTARYEIVKSYKVTATAGTGGSISPASVNVNAGSMTTFTVTPAAGYQINQISGCGKTGSNSPFTTPAITAACTVSASFSAVAPVATPVISPNGGSISATSQITLSTSTAGATIRYSTNGNDVTSSSPLYSAPFTLSSSATVKARAFKAGMNDSAQSSAGFTVTGASSVVYLHTDVLGSVVAETDANGNVIKKTEYKPFGEKKDN